MPILHFRYPPLYALIKIKSEIIFMNMKYPSKMKYLILYLFIL